MKCSEGFCLEYSHHPSFFPLIQSHLPYFHNSHRRSFMPRLNIYAAPRGLRVTLGQQVVKLLFINYKHPPQSGMNHQSHTGISLHTHVHTFQLDNQSFNRSQTLCSFRGQSGSVALGKGYVFSGINARMMRLFLYTPLLSL